MGRILAIDFGNTRCGIAVTDPLKIFAQALTTVHSNELIQFLKEYIAKESVEQFVIGKPLNEKGETQQIQENIDKLSGYLTKVFPNIPQAFVDERYTSRMAKFALVEAGIKKEKRKDKKLLDSVSATLILQTYLQMNP